MNDLINIFHNNILLVCPITKKTFIDPVIAEDGITYERSAIIDHFKNYDISYAYPV